MARTNTDVATSLDTHQKIALSFLVGTALMVLVSVSIAAVSTLAARRSVSTKLPGDQTFQTGR